MRFRRRHLARRLHVDTSHADPLVRQLFTSIAEHQVALEDLAVQTGVGMTTISRWRKNRMPAIHNLNAVFNALGYQLYVTPIGGGQPGSEI